MCVITPFSQISDFPMASRFLTKQLADSWPSLGWGLPQATVVEVSRQRISLLKALLTTPNWNSRAERYSFNVLLTFILFGNPRRNHWLTPLIWAHPNGP